MIFNVQLDDTSIRTVLEHLDLGPHGKVRRVFDDILNQVQKQEAAANTLPVEEIKTATDN